MRNRRDRERPTCGRCGREVTVTRSGRLMAHRNAEGRTCVDAAYKQRQQPPAVELLPEPADHEAAS